MPPHYIPLGASQLAIAAALILISGGVSLALGLGLERRLLWAACRTLVQLLLIGLVLQWIFAVEDWRLVVLLVAIMTLIAGVAAIRRTDRRYPGIWLDGIVSMWAGTWVAGAVALLAVVQVKPWYTPQYAIPLMGMILGNALNGISLGFDRLGEELGAKRGEVETLLALGATRWEAARGAVQTAVRTGMIPIINSMMVVGLVSLPGMMTGQMVANMDPMDAAKYQIAIMFLIAAGTSLGTVCAVMLGYQRLFTADHRFRPERLQKR